MYTRDSDHPFISVLVVTKNEQDYIGKAMLSLINQTYPYLDYEIIVIDGESDDKTLEITENIADKYKDYKIRIINNPKQILSAGWNLGIRNAKGEYVVRIDAHAEASSDFLEKNVETILSIPDAVCVGGRLETKSFGGKNDTISKILSSPFGVGNSSFRVSDRPGYTDTAVYGLYRKDIFEKVGYFNEQYVRNQDIEMHSRIRAVGGRFYFNPAVRSVYYSRNTIKKMVRQAFGNGKWNMVLLKTQNTALSIRHLVPFAFVVYLFVSTVLGFFFSVFWKFEITVMLIYLFMGIFFSIKKTKKISEIIKMPFLFLALHFSYGIGYLAGIFIKIKK